METEDLSDNPLISKLSSQSVYNEGFIRINPYNQIFNSTFKGYMDQIRTFPVNDDDIWITSFPKCGTTWTQEMVWCIMNGLDPVLVEGRPLDERIPFFEMTAISDVISRKKIPNSFDLVTNLTSKPRLIKSHLMYDMLPDEAKEKNVKIIHVTRNPRDACVSFYHHWKIFAQYKGTFEEFGELFVNELAGYYGSFFHNVLSYWNRRDDENIIFLTYEEMKKDLVSVIKKVAEFLNKEISEDEISALCEHLSFRKMKNNDAVNKSDYLELAKSVFKNAEKEEVKDLSFMRKGVVGDWKNFLSEEMVKRFEEWEKISLEGSDIEFVYE